MFDLVDPLWMFSVSIFGATVIGADAAYQLLFATEGRRRINRRLAVFEKTDLSRSDAIVKLRRERGLEEGARWLAWVQRLHVQSGATVGFHTTIGIAAGLGLTSGALTLFMFDFVRAAVVALIVGVGAPFAVLKYLRRRRMRKFGEQFPETIDIIVRSLRAGHPIAAAIRMAAREMPDPIGSEFGIAEDEITYGLDLEGAMRNLQERVGHEDLPLFVTSISIQTQSGGNLTEILSNLSVTIRERMKLKRKVRALSAEGRISALILGAVPVILFMVLNVIAPEFYGSVWHHPWIRYGLSSAGVWMGLGFVILHKMINFRV